MPPIPLPMSPDLHTLTFTSKHRFHYIEGDERWADGWYFDYKMNVGGYDDGTLTRCGPIPYEQLEQFVREHEHLLRVRLDDALAYLRREMK